MDINLVMSDLKSIGYSDWFKARTDDKKITAHGVARIVSVHKDSYTVTKGGEEIFAELSGNLLYCTESASDLPTTGDWVYADFYDDDCHAAVFFKVVVALFNQAASFISSFSGFNVTSPTGLQFRVFPDQRSGFLALANS